MYSGSVAQTVMFLSSKNGSSRLSPDTASSSGRYSTGGAKLKSLDESCEHFCTATVSMGGPEWPGEGGREGTTPSALVSSVTRFSKSS